MKSIRVILNGKGAANPQVREAIYRIRDEGRPMEVRCTWEGGDAARFAQEAVTDGVDVLVAGGGDGTIHEVVNGLMTAEKAPGLALGVLPLGTANDFARGCGMPLEPYAALKLASEGSPTAIDIPSANGVFFANVASGGFGAEVTVGTDPQLKKALGGGAYALTGIVTAAKMKPYEGSFVAGGEAAAGSFIALAVGNSRQAGGGVQVTRKAFVDDGLLDLTVVSFFEMRDLGVVVEELQNFDNPENRFVHYRQMECVEIEVPGKLPINLDGEPYRWDRIAFEVKPKALRVVLPEDCPVIQGTPS
jgi:lipid kinase YegS